MSEQVSLRCRCSKVRGAATDLSPETGTRIICYCADCQAFARFLERPDVLDARGGTDIVQMSPHHVHFSDGAEQLRCVRLHGKGMHRWYTECCKTPVGNTKKGVPFIGLIHSIMDHDTDKRARDEVLGKPYAQVQGASAVGGMPPNAHKSVPFGLLLRSVRLVLKWWRAGKGKDSPFFDAKGTPTVHARVLSESERAALGA